MKILWVSTSPIGPAGRILNMENPGTSGGWIQNEYDALVERMSSDINEMVFLCASRTVKAGEICTAFNEQGRAFCVNLPKISFGRNLPLKVEDNIREILEEVAPDIIHIWGTESCISYGVTKLSREIKKVVFLQGLIGIHNRYKGGYLEKQTDYKKYYLLRKTKKRLVTNLKNFYFQKQIKFEQYIITNSGNVILDNLFSESYCRAISTSIKCYYHYLKPSMAFLTENWKYDMCLKNTIFTVFGKSSEKGLHQLLQALLILKKTIPDIKLMIPGSFHCENGMLKLDENMSFYETWLYYFINENDLQNNVYFLGKLDVEGMVNQIKCCNIFVNPSCMEVHALSLREAMAVGAPCISSLCGSVIEYIAHEQNGLIYRYEEYEMLAYWMEKLLTDRKLCEKLSKNAKNTIQELINRENVTLFDIYKQILD